MKKRKSQKGRRFEATGFSRSSKRRIIEIEPKEAAVYVRRAEEYVIPLIEAHTLPPADAFSCSHNTRECLLRETPIHR